MKVKGRSVVVPLFRRKSDGSVGVVNLGEVCEKFINELKPGRVVAVHITEVPDPSINVGGVQGKKAVVTVIYRELGV